MPLKASHIYPATDPDFVTFPSRRSTVHSTKGICSSTQTLASQTGVKILQQGGNAADTCVAMAAVLNLTEPSATGIGGDCFCLWYDAKTKKVRAMNGSGRAGGQTSLEQVRKDLGIKEGQKNGRIPMLSVHSVTVPGAPAGWVDCVERFGSGKLSMEQIMAPAVELGEKGYPISELSGYYWGRAEETIRKQSPNGSEMLKADKNAPDGFRAPAPGELMYNPTLANTFRLLAQHGKKGFYEGPVAEAIIKVTSDLGGHLTMEDLKHHMDIGSEEPEAISMTYTGQNVNPDHKGVKVWEHPPNGQGIVALMALGILENLEKEGKISTWAEKDHNTAPHLHAVIEALRIAFADANWWVADPAKFPVPIKGLLDPAYLAERAKLFDPKKASMINDKGSPAHNHSDTVYFAATDSEGNGCSFINSNYAGFGTAIIPKGCGFTLQNRGANFDLEDGHPNVYEPGKRPYHTIIPAMITNASDDTLHSVYGVMGGFMQPQGHVQVLLNMECFKLTPQAAIDAPRICIGAGTPDQGDIFDRTVYLEEGISDKVVEELRGMGHQIEVLAGFERGLFGRGQLIRAHHDGDQVVFSAGSDPRGDGSAMPAI